MEAAFVLIGILFILVLTLFIMILDHPYVPPRPYVPPVRKRRW